MFERAISNIRYNAFVFPLLLTLDWNLRDEVVFFYVLRHFVLQITTEPRHLFMQPWRFQCMIGTTHETQEADNTDRRTLVSTISIFPDDIGSSAVPIRV